LGIEVEEEEEEEEAFAGFLSAGFFSFSFGK
jgi:hypothetical protein